MKKALFIMSIFFLILTFVGIGYVLYNGGKVSPGYAVIPMLFEFISIGFYRQIEGKSK